MGCLGSFQEVRGYARPGILGRVLKPEPVLEPPGAGAHGRAFPRALVEDGPGQAQAEGLGEQGRMVEDLGGPDGLELAAQALPGKGRPAQGTASQGQPGQVRPRSGRFRSRGLRKALRGLLPPAAGQVEEGSAQFVGGQGAHKGLGAQQAGEQGGPQVAVGRSGRSGRGPGLPEPQGRVQFQEQAMAGRAIRLPCFGHPGFLWPRAWIRTFPGPAPGVLAGERRLSPALGRNFLPGTWKGRKQALGLEQPEDQGQAAAAVLQHAPPAPGLPPGQVARPVLARFPVPVAVLRKDPDPQGSEPQGPEFPVWPGPGPKQGPAHGIGPDVQAQHQRLLFRHD
jgi:hypothetical protein